MEASDIEELEHHILVVEGVPGTLELEELQRLLTEIAVNHLGVALGDVECVMNAL